LSHESIRLATQADADGIIELIDGILKEYGDRICLTPGGSEADLLDIDGGYRAKGGEFWVLESVEEGTSLERMRLDPIQRGRRFALLSVCTFIRNSAEQTGAAN
jgi:hypothetical protein